MVSKLNTASFKGVKTNVDINTDLNNSSAKIYVLCKILGILLDNAIEASSQSKDKILGISMKYNDTNNNYCITISNSFDGNINLNQIFSKGYSSKGEDRGLGLWEVRNITNKNTSISLKTSINKQIFKQEVFVRTNTLMKAM
jgi:two-component system sensor histidine kinase AgrC